MLFLIFVTLSVAADVLTLTFDPLTLNTCVVLSVTWSNDVPYFSEIEQFTAEL